MATGHRHAHAVAANSQHRALLRYFPSLRMQGSEPQSPWTPRLTHLRRPPLASMQRAMTTEPRSRRTPFASTIYGTDQMRSSMDEIIYNRDLDQSQLVPALRGQVTMAAPSSASTPGLVFQRTLSSTRNFSACEGTDRIRRALRRYARYASARTLPRSRSQTLPPCLTRWCMLPAECTAKFWNLDTQPRGAFPKLMQVRMSSPAAQPPTTFGNEVNAYY